LTRLRATALPTFLLTTSPILAHSWRSCMGRGKAYTTRFCPGRRRPRCCAARKEALDRKRFARPNLCWRPSSLTRLLFGYGDRELLAAFAAATTKHFTTCGRAHTFPKTMGSFSALAMGLERPLRHVILRDRVRPCELASRQGRVNDALFLSGPHSACFCLDSRERKLFLRGILRTRPKEGGDSVENRSPNFSISLRSRRASRQCLGQGCFRPVAESVCRAMATSPGRILCWFPRLLPRQVRRSRMDRKPSAPALQFLQGSRTICGGALTSAYAFGLRLVPRAPK
jgi:hypothetical protein